MNVFNKVFTKHIEPIRSDILFYIIVRKRRLERKKENLKYTFHYIITLCGVFGRKFVFTANKM